MKYGNFYKFIIVFLGIILILCLVFKAIHREPGKSGKQTSKDDKTTQNLAEVPSSKSNQETNQDKEENFFWDVSYPESSLEEEEILPEQYNPYQEDDVQGIYYFTNTEQTIDETGVLPMYAQGILIDSIKSWLSEQGIMGTELRCVSDSLITSENVITFQAECMENGMLITCEYDVDAHVWSFSQ